MAKELEVTLEGKPKVKVGLEGTTEVEVSKFDYKEEVAGLTSRVINVENNKVDKISGKVLSTNDLTNELKVGYDSAKIHSESIHAPINAQKNVQPDWNQTNDTEDDFIKNKPSSLELTDLAIPALNTTDNGGEIPPTLWAWIVSIFPDIVSKSVKSFIIGILNYLKSLNSRVELLEESFLLKLVLSEAATIINLTTDKHGNPLHFVDGDSFEVLIKIDSYGSGIAKYPAIRPNGVNATSVYICNNATASGIITSYGTNYGCRVSATINVIGEEIQGLMYSSVKESTTPTYEQYVYSFYTNGLGASSGISSIEISLNNQAYPIPAGATIIVKKLK